MMLNATTTQGDNTMTYAEYEAKYDILMQTFLQVRYPEGNIPGTILTPADLTPDSVVNQIADLEETYPAYARHQLDETPSTITLNLPVGFRLNVGV